MKKLSFFATSVLAISCLTSSPTASKTPRDIIAYHIHSDAHPSNARIRDATHHFELYILGSAFSAISIEIPEGINIHEGIEVKNRAEQKIDAKISIQDNKATIVFSQPIPVDTMLSIEIKGVWTSDGQGRTWIYHIYGTMAGTNQEIPLGTRYVRTYR